MTFWTKYGNLGIRVFQLVFNRKKYFKKPFEKEDSNNNKKIDTEELSQMMGVSGMFLNVKSVEQAKKCLQSESISN